MNRYNIRDFPIDRYREIGYQKRRRGNQSKKSDRIYRDIIITFDIETSIVPFTDHSIMYIWQMQIGDIGTVFGRTWEEYIKMLKMLIQDMDAQHYIVVYVHNLSFEFQFLSGIYNFTNDEIFAIQSRKILKCSMYNAIEYRCSYLLTNNSLEHFTKNMHVEHIKRPGTDINYRVYRGPETQLTETELQYCQNDVLGLYEALIVKMNNDGDTLYTIPMTSTGYVRRDSKTALRMVNHGYIRKQIGNYELYQLLREAFRGGNTHANRFFAGQILHNVQSYDRASSYPDVQCNELFPIDTFKKTTSDETTVNRLLKNKRPFICRVTFDGLELTNPYWPVPYLTQDKGHCLQNALVDNGRILSADHYETTLTDIDLKIVNDEYTYKTITYSCVWFSRYGKLPPAYVHNIKKYYRNKTELKNRDDYNYMKSKNLLNSIYGMSAQDPVKQSIEYTNNPDDGLFNEINENPEELYNKYVPRAYIPYQWGVWTTALARRALEDGIKIVGTDCVYVDTDSVKYIGEHDFSAFNNTAMKKSTENRAYAQDSAGATHYMGVYEQEHSYTRFKTLGAKKYVYEYSDGVVHCTIAGVNKKLGGNELMLRATEQEQKTGKRADPLELFSEGFTFRDAGGSEIIYNDFPTDENGDPLVIYYNNNPLTITRNCTILDSEYTVGLKTDYQLLLALCGMEGICRLWDMT